MVFGLFENNGSLDLRVDGASFAPGQKITGTVVLKLAKTMQARGLRVLFYGEIMASSGKHRRIQRILQTRQAISGEKLYSRGESYDFELCVPMPVEMQVPDNALGDAMAGLMGVARPRGWFVHATLDIPGSADLNKRVQVSVAGEMIKTVKVPGNTREEQMAITMHNIETERKLNAGIALFGDSPLESKPAQPPAKPV